MSKKITIEHQGETFTFNPSDRQTKPWDPADYLQDKESIALYLSMIAEQGDSDLLIKAIGDIIRAQGIRPIIAQTQTTQATPYQQFSASGNPTLRKLLSVLNALGLEIQFVKKQSAPSPKAH